MKRYGPIFRQLSLLVLAAWIAGACRHEPLPSSGVEPATVTFSIRVPDSGINSRGYDAEDENYIHTVDVLVFEPGGDFLYTVKGTNVQNVGRNLRTFSAELIPGEVDVVILLNAYTPRVDWRPEDFPEGTPRAEIERSVAVYMNNLLTLLPSANFPGIPMYAEIKDLDVRWEMQEGGVVSALRAVAAVDFYVHPEAAEEFELETITLYYRSSTGLLIPAAENLVGSMGGIRAVRPSLPDAMREGGEIWTYDAAASIAVDGRYVGEIYMLEAEAGSDQTHPYHPCIVVGGTLKETGSRAYYRIDFLDSFTGDYLAILRNNRYIFNISQILGPGYETPEEALRQKRADIEVDVEVWNDTEVDVDDQEGQYYLSVSERKIVIDHTSAYQTSFTVYTDYPEWSYTWVEAPDILRDKVDMSHQEGISYPGSPQGVTILVKWEGSLPSRIQQGTFSIRAGNMRLLQTLEIGIRASPLDP